MSVGRRRHTPLALRQTRGRRICHLSVGGRPAISAARIRFSILGASSHSFSQLGWPQRWRGCVRRRRTHRPVGRTGRCVGPSIRPCRWRWYPTACAQGWCSRNRSGDKSRHRRARTTPVGGSPRRPVGRRTGEPRRCRVAKGREDLPRGTIRDLSTAHRSKASTNSWLLVALRFKARRDDRIFKPGRPALLRNADRPRPAEQKELFYSLQSRSPLTGRR
jgi:hypothetical protein